MHGSRRWEAPLLLRWPDGLRYDQERVPAAADGEPDLALRLVSVTLWFGVPVVAWVGLVAWFI
jgi:hypothetical protein